jgi:hypothetical protein
MSFVLKNFSELGLLEASQLWVECKVEFSSFQTIKRMTTLDQRQYLATVVQY